MKNQFQIFIILFVLLFSVRGCKSAELKTLEEEISVLQLKTAEEIDRDAQDKSRGIMGYLDAEIYVEYRPLENYSQRDVYKEIILRLKNNHWVEDECDWCDDKYFRASLSQMPYPIPLSIEVLEHPEENLVSVYIINYKP